ncbi:cytochrome c oxidase subunit 3 [Nocardia sp. NPDC050713]|uniref:cytochrome c oxidase subunit 3 n=1 Tax=Nocardia sp. NPDC050713 TaxID=3154511 RepID=UPI0033F3982B
MLTGIHLIHVLIGLAALLAMRRSLRAGTATFRQFDSGASYWHLVDLLWVGIDA